MIRKALLFLSLLLTCCVYSIARVSDINLDAYLREQGMSVTEGYLTPTQKNEFIKDMLRAPQIKKVLEIGFNAGHSADFFLSTTHCEKLVSFDINIHPYLKTGLSFISKKFGDRFTFIEGDSRVQVPLYAALNSDETFDLIFIDGGHVFDCCYSDIQNCSQLAHRDTIVFIDDYVEDVKTAVDMCVDSGLLSLLCFGHTKDALGERIWVVAKYLK